VSDAVDVTPIAADGQASGVSILPPCTPKQKAFAARLALGDSMAGACRYAGIGRTTGYEWQELPQVEREIQRYGRIAAHHGRRMLVGQIREAVRTVRRLMRPGGAAHKGAPTELMAAKLILDYVKIGELPIGSTQSRIVSRIPRDMLQVTEDTLDTLDARYQETALPTTTNRDGLPADFARTPDEAGHTYASPARGIPAELTDPDTYRRSMYRDS
jgi:hypothetical protein